MHGRAHLPRPGARLGAYPQRQDLREPVPWLAAEVARAAFTAPRAPSAQRKAQFLRIVHEKRALLAGCDIGFVGAGARRLRPRLAVEGLQEALVAELFAHLDASFRLHLGMQLHDNQLLAAWLMLERRLLEIPTGEGKTLAVALAAATGALAGIPVHVVTANDYLAERDADMLAPVFHSVGLSTGAVVGTTEIPKRAQQYRCDITYCTARELAFDYLRDRLAGSDDSTLLRGLCMAILDEADSVLIDEARLPVVLSGMARDGDRGAFYRQALFLAAQLRPGQHYVLDKARRCALLTEQGSTRAQVLARHMGSAWTNRRWREETLCLALAAQHLFHKDKHYLVRDKNIVIIDDNTGRAADGRVWSRGLHQLIETKENCTVTGATNTLAQTTFQELFSRYLNLSGVSGTLTEARGELLALYGLPVVRMAPRQPSRRRMLAPRVFLKKSEQWQYVAERAEALRAAGTPVLIGTDSVEDSEALADCLAAHGVPHTVLNARQDAHEAAVIAAAGRPGAVTISTNMAGRGTDIQLDAELAARTGLHVIACQVNDSARVDRQLYGRCARNGQAGSVEHLYCIENAFHPFHRLALPVALLCARLRTGSSATLPGWLALLARAAQKRRAQYRRREHWFLFLQERRTRKQLAFAGR